MSYSDLDLVNFALAKAGAEAIESLDDTDHTAKICNKLYIPTKDFVLRQHAWNCAIKKADLGSANVPPIECYFSDVVYNQGTYALKVIIKAAATAYNFLRHSYSSDLDISGLDSIKIDLRSTFVGTTEVYFKFHSKLSGDWESQTETISVENTWETKTLDISAIAQNLKEDVDRVEIRFENKTSDYMVYIDNMYATSGVSGDEVELDYMEYASNADAQDEYINDFQPLLFGFAYMFDLPDGEAAYLRCLRVLQVNEEGDKFRLEGRKLLTDADTVQLEYVGRITDPTQLDSILYDVIATKLAADLAVTLAPKKASALFTVYKDFIEDAKCIDANENTPKEIDDVGSWIKSR